MKILLLALYVICSVVASSAAIDVRLVHDSPQNGDSRDVSIDYVAHLERFEIRAGVFDKNAAAAAHLEDTLFTKGWTSVYVHTNADYEDSIQMMGAGIAEGFIHHQGIWDHKRNMEGWYFTHYVENGTATHWPVELVEFVEQNWVWMKQQVKDNADDAYWQHVGQIVDQLDGLAVGYNMNAPADQKLNRTELLVYQSLGDILDLAAAIHPKYRLNVSKMSPWDVIDKTGTAKDHCSGYVRILDDFSDVFFSQAAWFSYAGMHKVQKSYEFNLNNKATKSKRLSMSSYPGMLFSYDDFVVSDQKMAFLETTNEVANASLYDLVTYKSVLTWVRERVAVQMVDSGQKFIEIFSKYNSGSYNNGWLVLDLKNWKKGEQPEAGFLTLLEQIPGLIKSHDITTQFLKQGYWPSYNIPWDKEIYNMSGYPELVKKSADPDFWSYENCPRAKIFRRDSPQVNDLEAFMKEIRYNDFENDPLQKNDPGNAPASRYELKPVGASRRECFGAMDAKVANADDIDNLVMRGQGGPTHDIQPVFDWKEAPKDICGDVLHDGMPDKWDFDWEKFPFPNADEL